MAEKRRKRWTKKTTPTERIEGEFSFYFDVVQRYWAGGASEQRAAPLNRICTLARKMGVSAVLIEDALEREDVRREIEGLRKKLSSGGVVTATAISFLRVLPLPDQTEGQPDHMIGQVVVLTYPLPSGPKSYVFDAIMRVPARWEHGHETSLVNRCVPKAQTFYRTTAGCHYAVAGAYYCQENGVSRGSVQAALRIAIRSIEGTSSVDDDKLSKAAHPKGIADVIVKTLKNRGYGYNLYEIDGTASADDVWTAICSFIESGNPPLLVVSGKGNQDRIIPILGYTLNTDEWHPGGSISRPKRQSGWFSSSQWIDHVIVHDTELGPYFCMSRAWLAEELGRAATTGMKPRLVVAPIWTPQVKVSPVYAEQLAGQYLGVWLRRVAEVNPGTGRWWDYLCNNGSYVVLRTTFISSQDYQIHLQKLDDKIQSTGEPVPTWISPGEKEPHSFRSFMNSLPPNFWICEISLPQLYGGNRKKLGEILIDSRRRDVAGGILAIRLPSRAVWRNGAGYLLAPTGMDSHGELLEASSLTVS
ncbi:hypothetical protein WN73_21470 [Bradyrhizobium sp. CCBAU 45394]|uniref:hypothetical protein n=1 Tax=Bradyrhizobium sp. CCBAU 45394 TaxID=1325087 RepID=UPI002303E46A|nr:hypothetical protein [Bradyrhizobium sp. CCBAU 45394]MDA9393090.1 hypothetical protein [Bradyrhizobium sp. CCBAU 45394]